MERDTGGRLHLPVHNKRDESGLTMKITKSTSRKSRYAWREKAGSLKTLAGLCAGFLLAACGASNPPVQSAGHIKAEAQNTASIPEPVTQAPLLKRPQKRERLETYTVVVNQVPVRELLFSMARDARINLDIDDNISGNITMNAIDQTLPKILQRISTQAAITYTLKDDTLIVRADVPVLRNYDVHYLNIERASDGKVSISTEIGTAGGGIKQAGTGGGNSSGSSSRGSGDNKARTTVSNKSSNQFWQTLEENIASIISDRKNQQGKNRTSATAKNKNIIVNRESGTIGVWATARQHQLVADFINKVVGSAQRQVLIEATIAEVRLSDKYQAGVDWSVIGETATIGGETVLKK
ncbi:MAG TPA: hypothetical protein ENJ64_03345, partial [Thiotrichales bacterium]|nr:hypothetical protein [Thiotrichales bacterium]